MVYKILIVYLVGILLCQPVYIWAIRTLCRMEDEDEELYCQDNGMYYEPRKPNYPLLIVFLFLVAEHEIKGTKQGQQRLKWVVQQARGLLPKWLQTILSEDALMKIIDWWFKEVKDLLDDGKVNGSQN